MAVTKSDLYPSNFSAAEILSKGETALTPDVYTLVGEYVVKADELVGMGRGAFASMSEAIGRMYADIKDTSDNVIENGTLRIMMVSSQNMPVGTRPVWLDVELAQLRNGATDPSIRYVVPFDGTMLSKDKKWQFFIKNNTDTEITVSQANSTISLDVTRALL